MGALRGEYRCAVTAIRDAGLSDLDAIYDLLSARSRAAFGVSQVERRHVEEELRAPGSRSWVAGAVAGFARLTSSQELAVVAADAEVNDELLRVAEAAARERGFDHVTVYAMREDTPRWALLERSGFEHERDVLRMWRVLDGDLPNPAWPQGVTAREYTDADAERVHALLDEIYSAWDEDYVRQPHDDWLAWMTGHEEFDPTLWFLVERDGELVACILHWKEHQARGWIKDIVVRESERGRGLAKALIHHGLHAYAARGVERVGLKVDSTNPTGAPQLYEKLGFVTDQRQAIWLKRL
jgi:ribosomal protein S18 acetylase RimI-like enzyme